jgi:hypothetical protein
VPAGVGERLLDYARRLHPGLSQRRSGNPFSYFHAYFDVLCHRPVTPHQGLDHLGEGPAIFVFEAEVVDHLSQALGAAPDRVDHRL